MLLALSCTYSPVEIIPPENQKITVKTLHTPTEQIFTCLELNSSLSTEELVEKFDQTQQDFSAANTEKSYYDLICLSLARRDSPQYLNYAQELLRDMRNYNYTAYPDVRGLTVLLNYFSQLQEKRVAEVEQARSQIDELRKQLDDLKSIEQIINDRKNAN